MREARHLTPYQRIVRAAQKGRGVRLSANEVWEMAHDDAIETAAGNEDARADCICTNFDELPEDPKCPVHAPSTPDARST
jgi:hypothetical protein